MKAKADQTREGMHSSFLFLCYYRNLWLGFETLGIRKPGSAHGGGVQGKAQEEDFVCQNVGVQLGALNPVMSMFCGKSALLGITDSLNGLGWRGS